MKISPMFNRKYTDLSPPRPPRYFFCFFLGYGHESPRDTVCSVWGGVLLGSLGEVWRFGKLQDFFWACEAELCGIFLCVFVLSKNGKTSEEGASFLQQRGDESGKSFPLRGVNREFSGFWELFGWNEDDENDSVNHLL